MEGGSEDARRLFHMAVLPIFPLPAFCALAAVLYFQARFGTAEVLKGLDQREIASFMGCVLLLQETLQ